MSQHIHLDTRTSNFLDLLGNGKRYTIPPFQRDYSWTSENWDDLWNDIFSIKPNTEDRHYMGVLVAVAQSDREFIVIDGQQRLATLSILSLVVIHRLNSLAGEGVDPENNQERANALKARFIGEKDPASLILNSKLSLNETDDGFYQDYLVGQRSPANPRGLPRSNRLLWECFIWFQRKLASVTDLAGDGLNLAKLLNETVARQLLFLFIAVDDDLNAYTVFETLNARGLELSSTDLLKNYLFSRVKSISDLKALQRRWKNLIETVRQERFPEFLRYHLLCFEPQIRSAGLFKIVRDRVTQPQDALDLLDSLVPRAELFSAFNDASHEYWIDRPDCRPLVRERLLYGSLQSTPLLFAAWEMFSADDFARVLKLVNVITFRFTSISSLNQNELEPVYHYAAKAVSDGVATTVADVFGLLRGVYLDDQRFRQNFVPFSISTSGRSKSLAKFILSRMDADAPNSHFDFETDPATIEHILPENPSAEWMTSFDERDVDKWANRLGNLTLLEPGLNRTIGNAAYPQKVQAYQTSKYGITKAIPEKFPEFWMPQLVEARQNWMADRAVHLWRSDFA